MKKHLLSIILTTVVVATNFVPPQPAYAEEVTGRKKVQIINTTPIKVLVTDSTGKGLDASLGFKAKEKRSKGTICYICGGVPKECYEQSCDEIVIVHTPD